MRFILFVFVICCFTTTGQVLKTGVKPMICAHRGGFYETLPENSWQAFDFTIGESKSLPLVLEVDIRKSKEGTLYVLHDETVNRTTNGFGKIAELPDEYINALRLKSSSGELTDQRIPTLQYLLDQLKDKNVWLMLDCKTDVLEETAVFILKNNWAHRSIFLTFKPENTKLVYDISDLLIISALVKNENDWIQLKNLRIPAKNLIAYVDRNSASDFISQLHQAGLKVMTDASEFTTHEGKLYAPEYYRSQVLNRNLDILITDFPVEVAKIISSK
jgi:glycerophosphoryl diester phosphodiesterase